MGMEVGRSEGVKAEINVVPLIDIVLVLLIIFMVITPMLQRGEPVVLPEGSDPAKKPDDPDDVILSVKDDERMYLSNDEEHAPLTVETVKLRLAELHERAPSTPLYIKADKRLRYKVVKDVMLLCNNAGFGGVSLVADAPQ